ncbi:MAG: hypothetical protein JW884_14265 [Deltaproteobacteria bacterium]|nr:hypothetical protein [Deltaproteobacteria bacterium]
MPRHLSNVPCRMTFSDKISGDTITLFFRMPTPEEQITYDNSLVERKKDKIISRTGEIRQKYGCEILTGIGGGSFTVDGDDGKPVSLSSDPNAPGYRDDWKTLVRTLAPDVISMLSFCVFEQSLVRVDAEETEDPS